MKSIFNWFVILLLASCSDTVAKCVGQQGDEDSKDQKFVLVITLDSNRINSLLVNQVLKTEVSPNLINKIDAIRFQNPTSFLDEPILIEAKTDKRNRALATLVDQSVLERLEYQPVQMKIYDSNFSSVLVVLDRAKQNSLNSIPGQLAQPPRGPNDSKPFFIRLKKSRGISGTLKDRTTLMITTDFGDVGLPLDQVQGIRFGSKQDNRSNAFVVLTNGDTLTGTVKLNSLVIRSRWGEKELLLNEIESLTPASDVLFATDPNSQKRWVLAAPKNDAERPEPTNPIRKMVPND